MKSPWSLVLALLTVFVLLISAGPAQAQRVPKSVTQPAFSPYFQLFRDPSGVTPTYHEYYRPQKQYWTFIQQQNTRYQQQNTRHQQTNNRFQAMEQEMRSTQSQGGLVRSQGGAVPSNVGKFQNLSHFYRFKNIGRGQRQWKPQATQRGGQSM